MLRYIFFFLILNANLILINVSYLYSSQDYSNLILMPVENLTDGYNYLEKAIYDLTFYKSLKITNITFKDISEIQHDLEKISSQTNIFELSKEYNNLTNYYNYIIIYFSVHNNGITLNYNFYDAEKDNILFTITQQGPLIFLSNMIDDVLIQLLNELKINYTINDLKNLTTLHFEGFEAIKNIYETLLNASFQPSRLVRMVNQYKNYPLINYYIGKELYDNGFISESEDYFLYEINLNPENYNAYIYLSKCYEHVNDYSEALNIIQEIYNINSSNTRIKNRLADLYYLTKNYRQAIIHYKDLLLLNARTKDYKIIHTLANIYKSVEDYETAREYYEVLKKNYPNISETYKSLGEIYYRLNNISQAIENYKIFLSIQFDTEVYYELGKLSVLKENYEASVKYFKAIEEYNKSNPVYYLMLGDAYYELGLFEDAVKSYFSVIKFVPDNNKALFRLALANLKLNNYDIAKLYFERSLEFDDNNPDIYYYLGYISFYYESIKYDKEFAFAKAKYYLQKAVELDKKYFEAILLLGEIFIHNDIGEPFGKGADLKLAGEYFTIASEIDKTDYRPLYKLGLIMSNIENYYLAEIYLKNAIKINPEHIKSYVLLGDIYLKMEYYDLAIENYFSVLKSMPDNVDIYIKLAKVYFAKQDYTAGINSLVEAENIEPDNDEIINLIKEYEKKIDVK